MTPPQFQEFINSLSSEFTPIIDSSYSNNDYTHIDLSASNDSLNSIDVALSSEFDDYINLYLKKNNKSVAYGGYLERRHIYYRSAHFNTKNSDTERNIHLGLDVWAPAKTNVLTPLDGRVHSFRDNANFGDYGPTIVLEHNIEGVVFYTLYGHLSRASLERISVGDQFKKGHDLAILGSAEVNGDYAPHLHFQIIKNLEGNIGDYPGVSSKVDLERYKRNCPDPKLLLKIN